MVTIDEQYQKLHPSSFQLYQKALRLFPDGVTHDTRMISPFPIYATHGLGARKWDVDGNEYIDYVMGHGALLLGHSHPTVVSAVATQVAKGTHLGASHELEIRWAEAVMSLIPSAEKIRFTSSGTEATLMALRLARAYTGKDKIIKFEDHFHGWHDYVLAGAGRAAAGIPAVTWDSMVVMQPNDIDLVEQVLLQNRDIAGIILEPTGAHMGVSPIYPSFLRELRDLTKNHGVALIFDEVVTGFRTSPGGAQARYGVTPDLTSMAKILGGGLPGGAVAGNRGFLDMIQHRGDEAWDNTQRVAHPGTFNANPLSAAAGATALELLAVNNFNAHADAMAKRLKNGINNILYKMEVPGCANGVASLVHLTLGVPHDCDGGICHLKHSDIRNAMPSHRTSALKRSLINNGVDTMGGRTCIVSAMHQEADIDFTINAYHGALTSMQAEGII
ncbi:aspartate aminotransferase family protein [Dehalococcoidia bacterium]|nr:aspartate aminotransferase family protein [Dehalococcoidia bacterium]